MNARLFALAGDEPRVRATWLVCFAAASCAHIAVATLLYTDAVATPVFPVTEVELQPLATPPPPPPPPPPPEDPRPTAAAAKPARAPTRRAPDPPVARAGKVLTLPEETPAPADEEPVRFVSDPNGRSYGTGIVARGGLADHGIGSAKLEPPPTAAEVTTPADRLRREPRLIGDGCRGFYPDSARPNQGMVMLVATVSAGGAISRLVVESETPPGEGFANAARTCLAKRRFEPALDERGLPAAARTRINLRFSR